MFRITDAKTMSCAAGEPVLFELQFTNYDGVVEQLSPTNRSFTYSIYDATGTSLVYRQSNTYVDASGEFVRWVLDGSISEALRGVSGLSFEVSERLDNGRDQLMTGSISIANSAPRVDDDNDAPVARYITRIQRMFDPRLHGVDASYRMAFAPFDPNPQVPAVTPHVDSLSEVNNRMIWATL